MRPLLLHSEALAALGVPHAFSTRIGGYSVGPFSSLNFGNPGDLEPDRRDPPSNIAANTRLVLDALAASNREVVQVHQVHGPEVRIVRTGGPTHDPEWNGNDTKADAIVTDDPTRILAIRIADCAPVLLSTIDGRIVAAVHAGWRGVIAGVAPRAVHAMRSLTSNPTTEVIAAIGPCIGFHAFEVGPEVAAEFTRAFGDATPHVRPRETHPGKFLVDLKGALCEQLNRAGVPIVDLLPHCTATSTDPATGTPLFFSHRRDHGLTGRMVGMIGPRPD
ncbi:MAG: peptidoglycan editing factor PgeF [Phycisphaeraceae bacterium]|nr:peptidoglycan editing factor PgeF [Phycisphaeraceae bacterium]